MVRPRVKTKSAATRLFLRGLALVLPLVLTLALLAWVWNFLSGIVFRHVDAFVRWVAERIVTWSTQDPGRANLSEQIEALVPAPVRLGISVVISALLVLLVGWWFSGFLGRRVLALLERLLVRVPLISAIYPHIKQVVEFFLGGDSKIAFQKVVAVPYPHPGLYSLAFLTGSSLEAVNRAAGGELVSVFVPSSPMPATGYLLFVPVEDITPLDLTVDEALRAIVSGGVLMRARHPAQLAEHTVAPGAEDAKQEGADRAAGGQDA